MEFALGQVGARHRLHFRNEFHDTSGSAWSSVGRLRAVDGKPHSKARFTGAGFKFDFAPVTVADDAIADDEAKAGAGADGLGREKRLEQMRLAFGGMPEPLSTISTTS